MLHTAPPHTYREVDPPALEVNHNDEHQRRREEVGDIGQVLAIERLLEGAHLHTHRDGNMKTRSA